MDREGRRRVDDDVRRLTDRRRGEAQRPSGARANPAPRAQRSRTGTRPPRGRDLRPFVLYGGSATVFPTAMAIGAANDDSLAYAAAYAIAARKRAVGIQIIFGPVVDVNNNPNNPGHQHALLRRGSARSRASRRRRSRGLAGRRRDGDGSSTSPDTATPTPTRTSPSRWSSRAGRSSTRSSSCPFGRRSPPACRRDDRAHRAARGRR